VSQTSSETSSEDAVQHRLSAEGADQLLLAGVNDAHLETVARLFDCDVVLRSDELILSGPEEEVEKCIPVVERMLELARMRRSFTEADVEQMADESAAGELKAKEPDAEEEELVLPAAQKVIRPKSAGQREYVRAMRDHDITVGIGPAGTGKTYLAVAMAVAELYRKRVRKIILTRPAVEAGEELGFLPGDIREKVDPYLRPLYDALGDMMQRDQMQRAIEEETVEIAPLAYMRGRTLSDAFLILDEAQNATTAQMKMFLTRLGLNSQVVITGDKTQIDLSHPGASGLIEIEELLRGIDGIEFVYLSETDVVRHRLVKEIIRAYRDQDDGDGPS
jgi:phosphate starvation-inducible PhoH-like protein